MIMTGMGTDSDIAEKVFSYYLTGLSGQSYLDFGTPNSSVYTDGVIYIDILSENYWWSSNLTGFRWKGESTAYAISTGSFALTDTGSSCIVGPSGEADVIMRNILSVVEQSTKLYVDAGWNYIFSCPDVSTLPSFELIYGGYWFEVLPEDYLIDITAF